MSLRDAGVALIDCEHRTPAAREAGYPYIAIPQMREGRVDPTNARRISQGDFTTWTRKALPRDHDVVLSRRTNPGVTAVAPLGLQYALGQNLVLLRADGSRVYPPFLRWLVQGPAWWEQIGRFLNVGAVFDSLKCADVPNFVVPVPAIAEQRRISDILGALDDKIELNRGTTETLDALIRTSYASLIAEAYVDGAGWMTATIDELAEIVGGSTPSTSEPTYWENGVHAWATPRDLARLSGVVLSSTARRITDSGLTQISSGLLPVGTVLMSSRAPIGYLAIAETPVAVNQGFIAMKARPGVSNLFLLCWAASSLVEIMSRANGSTFLEISKAAFRPLEVQVPEPERMAAFDDNVRPFYERIALAERESRTLRELRDGVLPGLLDGRVDTRALAVA